ncbi:MAG: N-(5'-phosphoribosyl)anthranilate isomerase [Rhodopirellula sp.]|nr:N-(5'-phosphoribosyl)anthranilate isomerase [Rhodopirellula sp.]
MFHIKICGVREVTDMEAVFKSGADAIGLNFYPPSCRFVDPETTLAERLASKAGELGLVRVGVFVNSSVEAMLRVSERLELEAVQLHGDEQIGIVSRLRDHGVTKLIRAIKLPTGPLTIQAIKNRADPWASLGIHLLLDADGGRSHGGTGKTLDWAVIRQWAEQRGDVSWTLAGGLNPENVAAAITKGAASSVDTASGVEAERGKKSGSMISQFSENALVALRRS